MFAIKIILWFKLEFYTHGPKKVGSTEILTEYGDGSFSTQAGRIFEVCWTLAGTICLPQLFLCIAGPKHQI